MSLNTSDSATLQIIDVDPAGDVILTVGSEDYGCEASLRVSSKVLSLASPAFAAMVSPKWSDSANKASSSEPQHISLPEDSPPRMKWICQILHFRKDISTNKDISFLVGVAQLCDKYDLESPIKPWVGLCVESIQITASPWHAKKEVDLMDLMYISFVFRISRTFWFSSSTLLYAMPVPDLVHNRYAANLFEDDALERILEERQNILNRLREDLDDMVGPTLINLHESITLVHHLQELTRIGLWPLSKGFHKASTRAVLQKLKEYQPCNQSHCGCSRLDLVGIVKNIVQKFSVQRGLCVECYRNRTISLFYSDRPSCFSAFCGRAGEEEEINRHSLGIMLM